MMLQPISYRGRIAAVATHERFVLHEVLEQRPPSDPERTFVIFMCAYARDVLAGRLPGPYTNQNACRYVRGCLLPDELLERLALDLPRVARALQIPVGELRAARDEHHAVLLADSLLRQSEPL